VQPQPQPESTKTEPIPFGETTVVEPLVIGITDDQIRQEFTQYFNIIKEVSTVMENNSLTKDDRWKEINGDQSSPDYMNVFGRLLYWLDMLYVQCYTLILIISQKYKQTMIVADASDPRSTIPKIWESIKGLLIQDQKLQNIETSATEYIQKLKRNIILLKVLIRQINTIYTRYRTDTIEDLKSTEVTLQCQDTGKICVRYTDGSNIVISGEPVHYLMWSLFGTCCAVFKDIENLSQDDVVWHQVCNDVSQLTSTFTDIHNFLLVTGVIGDNQQNIDESSNFCEDLRSSILRAERESKDLEQITDVKNSKILYKRTLNQIRYDIYHLDNNQGIYKKFVDFLIGEQRHRSESFLQLQGVVNSTIPSDQTKIAFFKMYLFAIIMLMANTCQSETGFTVEFIKQLLTNRPPDRMKDADKFERSKNQKTIREQSSSSQFSQDMVANLY
jgi:hypothetical protein